MSDNGSKILRDQIKFRNYNLKTGQPFSAVELAYLKNQEHEGVQTSSFLKFTDDIETIKEELMSQYNTMSLKLKENNFNFFKNPLNEDYQPDDWEIIPEYEEKLINLKKQLDYKTQMQIQSLIRDGKN